MNDVIMLSPRDFDSANKILIVTHGMITAASTPAVMDEYECQLNGGSKGINQVGNYGVAPATPW